MKKKIGDLTLLSTLVIHFQYLCDIMFYKGDVRKRGWYVVKQFQINNYGNKRNNANSLYTRDLQNISKYPEVFYA